MQKKNFLPPLCLFFIFSLTIEASDKKERIKEELKAVIRLEDRQKEALIKKVLAQEREYSPEEKKMLSEALKIGNDQRKIHALGALLSLRDSKNGWVVLDSARDKALGIELLFLSASFNFMEIFNALFLRGQGKKPLIDLFARDKFGHSPLICAALNNHVEIMKKLLNEKNGPPLPFRLKKKANDRDEIPLFFSLIERGAEKSIDYLLSLMKKKNDGLPLLDARDPWGDTPLMKAAQRGHFSIVKKLMQILEQKKALKKALQERNNREDTPLMCAIKGYKEGAVVELILSKEGVDPNARDILGRTPIMVAARWGQLAHVKSLLAYNNGEGVDLLFVNKWGQDALGEAEEGGNKAIEALLLQRLKKEGKYTLRYRIQRDFRRSPGHWILPILFLFTGFLFSFFSRGSSNPRKEEEEEDSLP